MPLDNKRGEVALSKTTRLHTHTHRIRMPLLSFICILLIVLVAGSGIFYIQNKGYISQKLQKESPQTLSVDHLLLKVLLKEREFAEEEIRIMNIADKEQQVRVEYGGLKDIVSIDGADFSLSPGQTKVVRVSLKAADDARGIEQQPGVYIGNLAVKAGDSTQEIPLIVEIESKNVLFDANLNPVSLDRNIERGKDFVVEVRLFNLQNIDAQNINIK